jgi:hypothetical protein
VIWPQTAKALSRGFRRATIALFGVASDADDKEDRAEQAPGQSLMLCDSEAGVQIYRISDCIPVKQVFLTKPRPLLTVKLLTANSIGKALNLL